MENEIKQEEKELQTDLAGNIISKIKEKRLRMKSRRECFLEKLGLESALLGAILLGALLVNLTFYLLKKTGALKFLSLGIPGLKIFLSTIPYDYLILFVLSLILINYLIKKLELPYRENISCNRMTIGFFLASILIGASLAYLGVEKMVSGWSKKHIPREAAIFGQIEKIDGRRVLLLEDNGETIWVAIEENRDLEDRLRESQGKFLRAVGFREHRDEGGVFRAQQVLCCDED